MVRFLRFISGLAVTAILISGSATAQEPVSEQRLAGIVDKSVNGYIRPAFGRFAETASNLHDRLQAYCEVPDEAGFKALTRRESREAGLTLDAYKDKSLRRRLLVRMRACSVRSRTTWVSNSIRSTA